VLTMETARMARWPRGKCRHVANDDPGSVPRTSSPAIASD
jgi:hypothetical protein